MGLLSTDIIMINRGGNIFLATIADIEQFCYATIQASEAIAQHDFINIYNASGSMRIRRADASDPLKFANGFAINAIASGASGLVANTGLNPLTVTTASSEVWLSDTTPGAITTAAPSTSGHIVQPLGPAIVGMGVFFTPQGRVIL